MGEKTKTFGLTGAIRYQKPHATPTPPRLLPAKVSRRYHAAAGSTTVFRSKARARSLYAFDVEFKVFDGPFFKV